MSDVRISVPCLGSIHPLLVTFLLEAQARGHEVRIYHRYTPVQYARNVMVSDFLKSDKQRLWMIDADMIPPANAWGQLAEPHDIVGGLCPEGKVGVRDGVPVIRYAARTLDGQEELKPGIGLVEVEAVGAGSVIINRAVFDDLLLDKSQDDVKPYFRFVHSSNGRGVVGEDIDFCLRAREAGYTVMVDTNVLWGHHKQVDLSEISRVFAVVAGEIPLAAMGDEEWRKL